MQRSIGAAALLTLAACMTSACGSGVTPAESAQSAAARSSSNSSVSTAPSSTAPSMSTTSSSTTKSHALACATAPKAKAAGTAQKLPAKSTAAGKTFTATIQTNCGSIVVELYGAKAPQTVASFIALAKSYYANTPCHRLTTSGIYVLQCGDPTGTGTGTPGYQFGVENAPSTGAYPAGTLAMARGEALNSNGGQFFLVYRDSFIDPSSGGYTIFGKVITGLSVLQRLASEGSDNAYGAQTGQTGDGHPNQPIGIQKITITEKKA